MKSLLTLLLLFFMLTASSQSMINYTEAQVRSAMYPAKLNREKLQDGSPYLSLETSDEVKWWFFDINTKLVSGITIIPKTLQRKLEYISYYNSTYIALSSRKWRMHLDGLVLNIVHKTNDEGVDYFSYIKEAK